MRFLDLTGMSENRTHSLDFDLNFAKDAAVGSILLVVCKEKGNTYEPNVQVFFWISLSFTLSPPYLA